MIDDDGQIYDKLQQTKTRKMPDIAMTLFIIFRQHSTHIEKTNWSQKKMNTLEVKQNKKTEKNCELKYVTK
jgi:hypothetical protein